MLEKSCTIGISHSYFEHWWYRHGHGYGYGQNESVKIINIWFRNEQSKAIVVCSYQVDVFISIPMFNWSSLQHVVIGYMLWYMARKEGYRAFGGFIFILLKNQPLSVVLILKSISIFNSYRSAALWSTTCILYDLAYDNTITFYCLAISTTLLY